MKKKLGVMVGALVIVLIVAPLVWYIYGYIETVKIERDLEEAALAFAEKAADAFADPVALEEGTVHEAIFYVWADVEVFEKKKNLEIHILTKGETKIEEAQHFFEASSLMIALNSELFELEGYERVFIYFRPRYINTIQVGLVYKLNGGYELENILKNITDVELEKAIEDYFTILSD